jgi:hypothetical protein
MNIARWRNGVAVIVLAALMVSPALAGRNGKSAGSSRSSGSVSLNAKKGGKKWTVKWKDAQGVALREIRLMRAYLPQAVDIFVQMFYNRLLNRDVNPRFSAVRRFQSSCYTVETDLQQGTFTLTLTNCQPATGVTINGSLTGTIDLSDLEDEIAACLTDLITEDVCGFNVTVTGTATLDFTTTIATNAGTLTVNTFGEEGEDAPIEFDVNVDVTLTKVAEGTEGATCFTIPGTQRQICYVITGQINNVTVNARLINQTTIQGSSKSTQTTISVEGLTIPVEVEGDDASLGCATSGVVEVILPGSINVQITFDGDCRPHVRIAGPGGKSLEFDVPEDTF